MVMEMGWTSASRMLLGSKVSFSRMKWDPSNERRQGVTPMWNPSGGFLAAAATASITEETAGSVVSSDVVRRTSDNDEEDVADAAEWTMGGVDAGGK